ncbi:caspase, EACC1-associated type [Phormidesmis sp. 146-12]
MAKFGLLIGVSEYEPGLAALPCASRDVEALRQVLIQPEMGGFAAVDVTVLIDPQRQQMERAIYTLFADRQKDDLLLFYFSGHGVKDDSGKLYLATRETSKDRGRLIKPTAVSASALHESMNESRSQRQVIILDCCFSGAIAQGLTLKDDGTIDLKTQLGGKGRAILTSSTSTQYSFEQEGVDLSVYTRYLVEGIGKGAADQDEDGWISVDELHDYASRKVQEAAPAMTPKFYPVEEGYRIRLSKAPIGDPKLKYRKQVEEIAREEDGEISRINRSYLDALQISLGLSALEGGVVEAEVLAPYDQHQENLQRYEQVLTEAGEQHYPIRESDRNGLKRLQQVLKLRDEDVSPIEEQVLAPKQREYERQQREAEKLEREREREREREQVRQQEEERQQQEAERLLHQMEAERSARLESERQQEQEASQILQTKQAESQQQAERLHQREVEESQKQQVEEPRQNEQTVQRPTKQSWTQWKVFSLVGVGVVGVVGAFNLLTTQKNPPQPTPSPSKAAQASSKPTAPQDAKNRQFPNLPRLEGKATVVMVVNGSPITIEVDGANSPIAAGNFVDLVQRGVYNGLSFHRVVREPQPFVVQGGDPQSKNPKFPLEQLGTGGFIDPKTSQERHIPLEIKPENASQLVYNKPLEQPASPVLKHTRGAVGVARTSVLDSASSQFYFALSDLSSFLDGQYSVFGYVTKGMDVVDKIQQGDRIESAKVTQGLENLKPGK